VTRIELRATIGRGCRLDPDVLAGYPTGRPGKRGPLVLGPRGVVRAGTILYQGTRIGAGFETGHHVIVREDCELGRDVHIWSHSTIDYDVRVGSRVLIHTGVYVAQKSVIEDDVFLAPGVMLANDRWPIDRDHLEGPVLRRWSRIGINATILPGVEVGYGALVGAGSVVTRNVARWSVVAGVPARAVGTLPPGKRRRA